MSPQVQHKANLRMFRYSTVFFISFRSLRSPQLHRNTFFRPAKAMSAYDSDTTAGPSRLSRRVSEAPTYRTVEIDASMKKQHILDERHADSPPPEPGLPFHHNGPVPPAPIIVNPRYREEGISRFASFSVAAALILSVALNMAYTAIAMKSAVWPSPWTQRESGNIDIAPVIHVNGESGQIETSFQTITVTATRNDTQIAFSTVTSTSVTTVIQPIVLSTTLSTTTQSPSPAKVTRTTVVAPPTTTASF